MTGGVGVGRIQPIHMAGLVFLGFAWGSSYLFTEIGVRTIPPVTLAAARIVLATLLMGAVAWHLGHRIPRDARTWLLFAAAGFNGSALPFFLISWGLVRIDSSLAAILIATVPLFTLVLAHAFTSDDRITARKTAGVALGFAGVVVLLGVDALGGIGAGFWGQLAMVAASLSFAVTLLWGRLLRDVPPAVSSASALLCASFWILPASLIFEQPWTLAPSLDSVLAAVVLALLSTAAANHVFFWLVSQTRSSFVALSNYLQPAVALFWGVVLLGEIVNWRAAAALAAILIGVGISSADPRGRKARRGAGQ